MVTVPSHIDFMFLLSFGSYKFLPIEICPEKFISIHLEGLFPITFVFDDLNLNKSVKIMSDSLKSIKKIYGKEYIFTKPLFVWKYNQQEMVTLKIGMMKKKNWKEICKKKKKAAQGKLGIKNHIVEPHEMIASRGSPRKGIKQ